MACDPQILKQVPLFALLDDDETEVLAGQVEITTFRSDHDYADHRRPAGVTFGDRVEEDLARRDFTINALAWGGRPGEKPAIVDPFGGRQDVAGEVIRSVGDARTCSTIGPKFEGLVVPKPLCTS